jgi:hypothetical protein
MLVFYKYRKYAAKRSFRKAKRTLQYMGSYGKWYYSLKFNLKNTLTVPYVHSWHWRSLYVHKKHINNKEYVTKALLLHLFWVVDIWKLKHPLSLKAVMAFPTMFYANIPYTNPLELYGTIHRWKYRYGFKKHKLFPYIMTPVWADYKSEQWVTRSYFTFMNWRKKSARYYKKSKNSKLYHCLFFWFLTNRYFHTIQGRLYCKTFTNPFRYSKVLWLRLLQYPIIYDYRWFSLLTHLARYRLKALLPWDLMYTSRDTWTFDPTARKLELLFHSLVKRRVTITEYILIKHWKNLLRKKDALSKLVQVKIRTSPLFIIYRKNRQNKYKSRMN